MLKPKLINENNNVEVKKQISFSETEIGRIMQFIICIVILTWKYLIDWCIVVKNDISIEEKTESDKIIENLKSSDDVEDDQSEKDEDKASIVTLEDTKSTKPDTDNTKAFIPTLEDTKSTKPDADITKASITTLLDTKSTKPDTQEQSIDEIDKSQTKSTDKSDTDHLEISSGAQKLRDMLQVTIF